MMHSAALSTMLAGVVLAQTGADDPVEIRLVANMGVLVSQGESKVLIDALFADVERGVFREPSAQDRDAILNGTGAFEGVDALLVTHRHADHFNADEVGALLRGPVPIPVLGPDQVRAELRASSADADWIAEPAPGEAADSLARLCGDDAECGFSIEARPLFHNHTDENLSYAVTFGGTTILHLGDADPRYADFSVWDDVGIDVVLHNFWFADSEAGRTVLQERWAEARHIALHVPAVIDREQAIAKFGEGHVLVDPGERITINPGDHD